MLTSDTLARKIYISLVQDFRVYLGKDFAEGALTAFLQGPREFRAYEFPALGEVDIFRFKAYRQLQNLFKRYRFESDAMDKDDVTEKTVQKYVDFQTNRSVYMPFRASTSMVLKEARRICKDIISLPYEPDVFKKIGRRAELAVKLSDAFFDKKLGDATCFTCPSSLRADLFSEAACDPLFKRLLRRLRNQKGSLRINEDVLRLTLVPKSWKVDRPITPLTTYGLYWSYGIGGFVQECLRISNLDITRLQEVHKFLAKKYSVSRTHVTADASSASDSIRSDLLNRVLPRFLYNDLKKTFTRKVLIDGVQCHTESVLPMGNAATFPVETLFFYCLIKAVGNLLKVGGTYSVYGDDMIYPSRIHRYVLSVFTDLGIVINEEKTFVKSHFRESCGGDYYHGCDVRPALYPAERMSDGKLSKLRYLYKVANALRARWCDLEIPNTIRVLQMEILALQGEIYFVPPSFPSESGWQTDEVPLSWWLSPSRVFTKIDNWTRTFTFKHLGTKPNSRRLIHYEDIYYWAAQVRHTMKAVRYRNCVRVEPKLKRFSYDKDPKWGRYCRVGVNAKVAELFLKNLRITDNGASLRWVASTKSYGLVEATHLGGTPRVMYSTSVWV